MKEGRGGGNVNGRSPAPWQLGAEAHRLSHTRDDAPLGQPVHLPCDIHGVNWQGAAVELVRLLTPGQLEDGSDAGPCLSVVASAHCLDALDVTEARVELPGARNVRRMSDSGQHGEAAHPACLSHL